jgi:hypothetical protein
MVTDIVHDTLTIRALHCRQYSHGCFHCTPITMARQWLETASTRLTKGSMLYNATHIVRRCLAAFVVGVLFATFGGIWEGAAEPTNRAMVAVLLIAGIIIGLLNITGKEATAVLMATMALVLLGIWGTTAVFQPVYGLSQGLG